MGYVVGSAMTAFVLMFVLTVDAAMTVLEGWLR